jgi:hypothetical protein
MIDMPYPGMIIQFKASGLQYQITSVGSEFKELCLKIISFGTMNPSEFMSDQTSMTSSQFIDVQRAGYVEILLPTRPTFEVLT